MAAARAQVDEVAALCQSHLKRDSAQKEEATAQLAHAIEEVSKISEQNVAAIERWQQEVSELKASSHCMEAQLNQLTGADTQQTSTAQV